MQSEKIPHAQPALHSRRAQQFAEAGLKIATDTAGSWHARTVPLAKGEFDSGGHESAREPIALTAPRRSQRETAVSDDDVESYQLPSHQFEVPVVLVQDSIVSVVPVDLEPIPESVL